MGWAARANSNPLKGQPKPALTKDEREAKRVAKREARNAGRYLSAYGRVTDEGESRYELVELARQLKDGTVRRFRKLLRRTVARKAA